MGETGRRRFTGMGGLLERHTLYRMTLEVNRYGSTILIFVMTAELRIAGHGLGVTVDDQYERQAFLLETASWRLVGSSG